MHLPALPVLCAFYTTEEGVSLLPCAIWGTEFNERPRETFRSRGLVLNIDSIIHLKKLSNGLNFNTLHYWLHIIRICMCHFCTFCALFKLTNMYVFNYYTDPYILFHVHRSGSILFMTKAIIPRWATYSFTANQITTCVRDTENKWIPLYCGSIKTTLIF